MRSPHRYPDRRGDDGDNAKTSVMKVDTGAIKFDHSGQSAIFAPVEWTNQ